MAEYRCAGATDVGRIRSENQDAVLPDGVGQGSSGIVAVADGLGGHPGGDIASRSAIGALVDADPASPATDLVRTSHDQLLVTIMEETITDKELIAMATTLTLAVLPAHGPIEVGHVGDSRAYLLDSEGLHQITDDHTHGMDLVLTGELTLDEAKASPDWHVLSNWLGFESFRVATHRLTMAEGDRLLLCTDGLTNMLTDAEISELLMAGDPAVATSALIDAANAAGGADNISVVVVEAISP